jgi:hypothetical protein
LTAGKCSHHEESSVLLSDGIAYQCMPFPWSWKKKMKLCQLDGRSQWPIETKQSQCQNTAFQISSHNTAFPTSKTILHDNTSKIDDMVICAKLLIFVDTNLEIIYANISLDGEV